MANKYWKGLNNAGGTGVWSSSTAVTPNWTTTSSGTISTTPPTAADTAVFDAYSGNCSFTGGLCGALTLTTAFTSTLTLNKYINVSSGTSGLASILGGNLDIGAWAFQCWNFTASGTTAKQITFGAGGYIFCYGSGVAYTTSDSSGLSLFGTPDVLITGSTATTVTPGTVATGVNFRIRPALGVTVTLTANNVFNKLDFTGFTGTLAATTIYVESDLTIPSTVTIATSSTAILYLDSILVPTIPPTIPPTNTYPYSNINVGAIVNRNVSILGQVKLGSALTLGATNGTLTFPTTASSIDLDLNGNTLSCFKFKALLNGYLTFNGGTLLCTSSTTTTFDSALAVVDTSRGSRLGTISMTGATAKTFIGGDTYYCTLNNGGAGALTLTTVNTFNDLTATSLPSTIILEWGYSQTFLNGFSLSGTAGNLVTLKSNLATNLAYLVKASGVVSTSYLSIKDIDAAGGAAWYAPPSQGNVDAGGNIGWSFTLPAVLVDLASDSYATSSLVGTVYGETTISSTALTTASASASINLLQSLDSVSTCYAFSAGNINSSLGLLADASALPLAVGNVNSVLGLNSTASASSLLSGDIYSTIGIGSNALSVAIAHGSVTVVTESSIPVALNSSGYVSSSCFGAIDLSQALTTTAQVASTVLGNINSTLPISASAFAPTQATASIYLDMYISGQPTAQSSCLGGVGLTQTLLSNVQVNTSLAGSMYAKLGLSSYSHSQALSIARLTFPSLYVGDLTITSLTPIHDISSLTPIHSAISLTPIHDISSLTPLNYIGLFH